MRRIWFLFVCLLAAGNAIAATTIVTGPNPSSLEQLAARELQKYQYAGTDSLLPIAAKADGDAIAIGTPASNPLVAKFKPQVGSLGDEGYLLKTFTDGKRKVLIVTGNTPNAVLYGAYALLEEYGFGFYLGGDAIPAKKPFALLDVNFSRKPALEIRGTLPWYNFFNSPTAWDFEDYAWFFDQLSKTKNNFIGFHVYDYEPFAAYEEDGKYKIGEPLCSTEVGTWGTVPMETRDFGFGTSKYFSRKYFGALPSLYRNDRERSIRDSQELLKRALDYAHARGLKTCLGFEVSGDPTDPANIDTLEKRLKHLTAQYPMLDYVWIWETEAMGLHGFDPPSLDSDLGAYYRRYEKELAYLDSPRKITEAVRLAIYTREAHRILREIAPNMRLILSGWGGDNHLHCTDFYPGLDKIVPQDVIFSALDNIVVSDKVSAAYGKLSPKREYWPIPWFEYDGDQWHPQPNASRWLNACRDSLEKGSRGVLGIHWRTRDVEESHAIMSQFAWNPNLTYEGFYADYAKRCFGQAHASEMADILMQLQSLGYRLVGGGGQAECGHFGWGSPIDPEKVGKLEGILAHLKSDRSDWSDLSDSQEERMTYLIATAEFALAYERTAQLLAPQGEVADLLKQARDKKVAGGNPEAAKLASEALAKLEAARFDEALDACARRVTNKGELGVLATVNAKAFAAYQAAKNELTALATPSPTPRGEGQGGGSVPSLSPINPNSVWPTDTPLPIKVVARMDGCRARVMYRSFGESESKTRYLGKPAERYFEGTIPSVGIGVEYAIELFGGGKVITRWPGEGLMHQVALISPIEPSRVVNVPKQVIPTISNLTATRGEGSVVLQWTAPEGRYEIGRAVGDGEFEPLKTVSDTWFEDRDVLPGKSCRYTVTPIGGKGVATREVQCPEIPNLPAPTLSVTPAQGKIILRWGKASLGTNGFLVNTAPSEQGPWTALDDKPVTMNNWSDHRFVARAEPGKTQYYQVIPLDRLGGKGQASNVVECSALEQGELSPILSLDFEGITPGTWGTVSAVESVNGVPVAHFKDGNYLVIPNRPEFSPDMEITLEMWVMLEKPGVIPVLLSHGLWQQDGYFLQILGGGVRFFVAGVGTLDAGRVEAGKSYHIAATYDGAEMAVYLNGALAGLRDASGVITPCGRNLYIGRYEYEDSQYQTECRITAVKLYPTALTPQDVKQEYDRLAGRL